MANKQYFTRLEVLEDIREAITDYNLYYYDEITHEAFNQVYYVDSRQEAEEALEQYGTFDAIGKINQHERDLFGETYTNFADPKEVANTLYYILGEETLHGYYPELSDAYYSVLDCEVNEENDKILLDVIDKLIAELK